MIEIIKELNIEVSKPNVFQAVVAKQYDMNTRFIKATFVDGGNKIYIDPEATVKVVINALRPDGESKGFDGEVNQDGTVTVPLHSWMLELVGTVICDISVIDTETDDNKKLTTTSFTLLVEKAAYGGSDVTNDPQYDVLVQLLETCSEAGAVAEEALQKSNEANSKYDACVEATERANQAASGVITIEQNNQTSLQFWVGSQEEYDALENKEAGCFYIISDDNSLATLSSAIAQLQTHLNEPVTRVATPDDIEPKLKELYEAMPDYTVARFFIVGGDGASAVGNFYECYKLNNLYGHVERIENSNRYTRAIGGENGGQWLPWDRFALAYEIPKTSEV